MDLNWQAFVAECESCERCELAATRQHVVIWRGHVPSHLMFIGEGPGADEDRLGKPFVGRSGQLLDTLFTAFGLEEKHYHIGNIIKCRPPGNRNPLEEEVKACRPLLERQIELVKPQIVVLLGGVAYKTFTGQQSPISRVRGHFFEQDGYSVMPTFHPAYVLRDGRQRKKLWADIGMARRRLEQMGLIEPLSFI
ncbi:MAG TPA: uracil-DNA glycosylase [Clostridiaceae bacterium]|nr:uracil-DNA glycosylase [Clostridiaceae bacterium]